jgi:hypothetical protein
MCMWGRFERCDLIYVSDLKISPNFSFKSPLLFFSTQFFCSTTHSERWYLVVSVSSKWGPHVSAFPVLQMIFTCVWCAYTIPSPVSGQSQLQVSLNGIPHIILSCMPEACSPVQCPCLYLANRGPARLGSCLLNLGGIIIG